MNAPVNAPARAPLMSLDDALAELLAHAAPLAGTETVSTFEADRPRAGGRTWSRPCTCRRRTTRSMDGYAVRCADVPDAGAVLPVSQRIPAGARGAAAGSPARAARIFTGAPIPAGADAVVMQEDTRCGRRRRARGAHQRRARSRASGSAAPAKT